jgi:hypothetical protein
MVQGPADIACCRARLLFFLLLPPGLLLGTT